MAILDEISAALQAGRKREVEALVQAAVDADLEAEDILDNGLLAGMDEIGVKFSAGQIFVPEMMVAARAMNAGLALLKPLLIAGGNRGAGKAVIGTVKGDMHDIGKNLVKMMIEAKGVEVHDLGVDADASSFIDYLQANADVSLVCLSTLLTTTMPNMRAIVEAIIAAGLHERAKIMVGGAPVTQEFANEIGADAYTADAGSAAAKAVELLAGS